MYSSESTLFHFRLRKNKLQYGTMTLITARFGVCETTVRNIVQAYNEKIDNHERYPDLSVVELGLIAPELADCIVDRGGYKMTVTEFTQVFNGIYETTIPITTKHKYLHQLNGVMSNSHIKLY